MALAKFSNADNKDMNSLLWGEELISPQPGPSRFYKISSENVSPRPITQEGLNVILKSEFLVFRRFNSS
jgi:hypothetical protein